MKLAIIAASGKQGQALLNEAISRGLDVTAIVRDASKISQIVPVLEKDVLFDGLPKRIEVGRYHSWAAEKTTLPECLTITAVDEEGMIMALAHKEYDVRGVQFHPESVLTPQGKEIIKNFLNNR